jgi:hypothetical protein
MKYMARDKNGRPVALLLFGSAAWKCKGRDDFHNQRLLTVKSMYLYPLVKNYRKLLRSETDLIK